MFRPPSSSAAKTRRYLDQTEQAQAAQNDSKDAHGSSEWMLPEEIQDAGLLDESKPLIFGRSLDNGRLLRYGGDGHCLTFAPTGAGKGVSVVVPNLLKYRGSVVCIDPKGAIAAVTARERRAMDQKIVLLDPFDAVAEAMKASGDLDLWELLPRSTYNPFSKLDRNAPYIVDDVRVIVGSLIVSEDGKNRFFSDSARAVLEGLILYLLTTKTAQGVTIEAVLGLAFDTRDNYEKIWLPDMRRYKNEYGGKLERLANQIEEFLTGEMGASVWSTLRQNLGLLDTDSLRNVLQPSDLDFSTMKDTSMTVYLVLPAHALETHGVWLRLMLAVILRQLSDARTPKFPVLFMVDECATLGRLEILETAVGLMRGYGMKLWLIFQDLPQLKTIYGNRWQSFISNSGVKQFFNVNDLETAEFVCNYLGKETRDVASQSVQIDQIAGNMNLGLTARALLEGDEVRRLGVNQQILFYEGLKPIRAQKISYHSEAEFEELAALDPYHYKTPTDE